MSESGPSPSVVDSAVKSFRSFILSRPSSPVQRPPELVYGVDDVPPLVVILFGGLQHVALISISLIIPLTLFKEAGVAAAREANLLSLALIALGLATFLQCIPVGPVGSGFLCPATSSAIFLAPALVALKTGGLALVFGLSAFSGALEAAISPVVRRIRPLLPVEIGGIVIFFVGMTLAVIGFRYVFVAKLGQPLGIAHWSVAAITLGLTMILSIWGKGLLRLLSALIGMVAGYVAAWGTGLLTTAHLTTIAVLPFISFPTFEDVNWSFSITMILPFAIVAIAGTMKTIGTITICQRANDDGWVRPEMGSISRGVLAEGIGNVLAGVMGSMGVNTAASSPGLAIATGVTSRVVCYAVGGILIALAFFPSITNVLVLMPRPVMGALQVFIACFILINGLQTITSRLIDVRRTFVIGLGLSSGVAVALVPSITAAFPPMLRPMIGLPLVAGTMVALVLNVILRIGQKQTVKLVVHPTDQPHAVEEFFRESGRRWGARKDVIDRVAFGIHQAVEVILGDFATEPSVLVEARFDEFNLDVRISYQGAVMEFPDRRPTEKEIMESESGHLRLAGFMLRRNADSVYSELVNGKAVLRFHFDH
jgi:xanthine permease XanP